MELPIANGFYVSDSLPVSHQTGQNVYVNIPETTGLSERQLFGTPGISQDLTTGDSTEVNRGALTKGTIPYEVNGNTLYSVIRSTDSDGVISFDKVSLGTVAGTGRVSMATNGTQLMILVPGGKGYIYNEAAGTPFAEITDADFTANGAPQIVVFIDGYFACTTDSKKWIISALNDGLSWGALDFSTAESDPDTVIAPVVHNNQIFITGSETTEGFQNVGGDGFPFQRNGIYLDKGCYAPFSLINSNSAFYMVGGGKNESPAIWQFSGNNFTKISTHSIESVLQDYTDAEISESFALSYSQKGSFFVCFSFPDRSFVYEISSGLWHERTSQINEVTKRWRVNSIVTAYGRLMVGDSEDGRIGTLSLDEYQEYGINIVREFTTQPFANGGNEIVSTMLELTMESGVGSSLAPDPQVSLTLSNDGKTWGYERIRSVGKIGEYGHRIIWRKNGRFARMAVFKFRLSDPVKAVFIKLEYE